MRIHLAMALLAVGLAGCGDAEPRADAAATSAGQAAATASAGPTAGAAVAEGEGASAPATAGPVYLDVRTPEEFAAGHVEGTLHIPLADLDRRQAELEAFRDRDIVVYCRSGRRAASAIEMLQANGFSRLTNGGGLTDMSARGLPITR